MVRKFFLALFLSLVFLALGLYQLYYSSPYNSAKIEELVTTKQIEQGRSDVLEMEIKKILGDGQILDYLSSNFLLTLIIFDFSFLFLFYSLHLLVDKLFFKKFYEVASGFDAIRRGILVLLGSNLSLYFYFIKVNNYVYYLVIGVIILLEFGTFFYFRQDLYNLVFKLRKKYLEKNNS